MITTAYKFITKTILLICAGYFLLMAYSAFAADQSTLQALQDQQRIQAMQAAAQNIAGGNSDNVIIIKEPVSVADEEASQIEKNVAESLDGLSFEDAILKQQAPQKLSLFGYEMFTGVSSTFAPVSNPPTPKNYIIGPGDTFTLQIYSVADLQYSLTVTSDGLLLVPELGAVSVSGLTFEEAKAVIESEISQQRIGAKVVITLSELRSIQVMMVGEVRQPGTYTVSGFSTLISTLISSGGIKRTGSLRNIMVKRNGRVVATLDLYDLLLRGEDSDNIYMRQGDIIFVPPIGPTISISGEVHRPAIYEMKQEHGLDQIIDIAGVLLPTAAASQAHIERLGDAGGYAILQVDLEGDMHQYDIQKGDLIRIMPVLDQLNQVILLSGHVLRPGGYQWKPALRVNEVLENADSIRQGAEFNVAMVLRENEKTKRTEVIYFNLGEALDSPDSEENVLLNPRDRIIIFDTYSSRAKRLSNIVAKMKREATVDSPHKFVEIKGFIRHPGTYPLEVDARLLEMANAAGGLESGLDKDYAILARSDEQTDNLEFIHINLNKAQANPTGDYNPILQPKDKIYLFDKDLDRATLLKDPIERVKRETPFGEFAPVVKVSGAVMHPGSYPMVPGMQIKDLISAAGGMTEAAYGATATLSRQAILEGGFSQTFMMPINMMKKDPLLETAESILHPYDHLILRSKPEWVGKPKLIKIEGEVVYPGEYRVDKRETLCSLVQRVGGFTEDAYLFGTVFTRKSVRQAEQVAMDETWNQLRRLYAEKQLAQGKGDQGSDSTAETFQILEKMAPKVAKGRMVINLAQAVNECDSLNDVVLEDGDKIFIPKYQNNVNVVGQVYFPTAHQYKQERLAMDYIHLSGGARELAQLEHAYVVQANGEVNSLRSATGTSGWLQEPDLVNVTPGATIYVPLAIDAINERELTETWVDIFYKVALSAASLDFLFN